MAANATLAFTREAAPVIPATPQPTHVAQEASGNAVDAPDSILLGLPVLKVLHLVTQALHGMVQMQPSVFQDGKPLRNDLQQSVSSP